jgi:hypothetical protein
VGGAELYHNLTAKIKASVQPLVALGPKFHLRIRYANPVPTRFQPGPDSGRMSAYCATEPGYHKNRPLSSQELKVVRTWLNDNLRKGFICESHARCASPLMLAMKPGGGVRICQDYQGLYTITIKNRYPLPLIREILDALCRTKVYT